MLNVNRSTYMIPTQIINSFEINNIPYKRSDAEKKIAAEVLTRIGLNEKSQAYEYYYYIYGSNIINPRAIDELIDIADESIFDFIDYTKERYSIPSEFIPLSSDQAEGMFLLNIIDNKVYDFELSRNDFDLNDIYSRWDNFYDFLFWYINQEIL